MPYVRRTWQNAPSSATPLNAAALNNIENGVEEALDAIADLPATIGALVVPERTVEATNGLMVSYGHSFLAEGSSAGVDAADYWGRRLARMLGLKYPTNSVTNDLKRAIGGIRIDEVAVRMVGNAASWVPGTKGLCVIQGLLNTVGFEDAPRRALELQTARNSLRSMLALVSSSERVEFDETVPFVYSGAWATSSTTPTPSGGTWRSTTAQNAYVRFTAPAVPTYALLIGKDETAAGVTAVITDLTTGTVLGTIVLTSQISSVANTVIYHPFLIPAASAGHTIEIKKSDAAAGSLAIDVLLPQSTDPTPVLLMKEPHLNDYTTSVLFPYRSDEAIDAFNAVIDEVAAEFPNAIVADPNDAGFWDKTRHITADGVHPNAEGNLALARTAMEAINSWASRRQVKLLLAAQAAAGGGASAYSSDAFTRADSATVGSTEVGAFAWTANPGSDQSKWIIAANRLVKATGSALVSPKEILVDDGHANGTITVTLVSALTTVEGVSFRVSADGSTGFMVDRGADGVYRIRSRSGASYTTLATSAAVGAAGDIVSIVLNGSSIVLNVNGAQRAAATSAINQTATRHGVYAEGGVVTSFDNWSHTP